VKIAGWLLAAGLAMLAAGAAQAAPLKVYGNTTTLELAPVLLAARTLGPDVVTVTSGGIPDLYKLGGADAATNAETQALRVSVDHPDLRIIFTVAEGRYRIVARRSAGIAAVKDLKGRKIATFPNTSSAYYLHLMLAREGLSEADVTIVPVFPLSHLAAALKSGEVDAVTIWEPEIQNASDAIGADAVEFQDLAVYRELFNLNATASTLADPAMRARIVAFVRQLVKSSAQIRRDPKVAWPLVSAATGYDPQLLARVWRHEAFAGTLASDLLDVLEQEEPWVARERNRTPRTRAELAELIDPSVLAEALKAP
jgi:NitT/TauT family transport system substrate-binding protein